MTPLVTPVATRRPRWHELTVTRVERLTDTAVAVSFAVPDELAAEYAFEPGQHLTLRHRIDGQDVRRSYSICLSRADALRRKEIRVGSAVVPGGAMSTWLNEQVAPGDRIEVLPPLARSPARRARTGPVTTSRSRPGRGSPRSSHCSPVPWRTNRTRGPR